MITEGPLSKPARARWLSGTAVGVRGEEHHEEVRWRPCVSNHKVCRSVSLGTLQPESSTKNFERGSAKRWQT